MKPLIFAVKLAARLSGPCSALALGLGLTGAAQADGFTVTNLVTDNQGVNAAQIIDSSLKNAWGMSSTPTSPIWVSNNATGVATLYNVNPATNVTVKQGLTVSIPGDGSVTGQTFNPLSATAFNGNNFLFVSEDGTISGWKGALGTTAETLAVGSTANVYKGTTFGSVSGNGYLYSANFRSGAIDVLKGDAGAPNLSGHFTDPNLPSGYAPFNIQNLGDKLYVTYAVQDGAKHDDVAGAGNGLVDVFDLNGNLISRVATNGSLNSPWGLAIAPGSFEQFSGDLLVGNFGNGTISVFDLAHNNTFVGLLPGANGNPVTIDGLWGLRTGNDGSGGSINKVYFTAGPNGEQDGLFGVIESVPEPESYAMMLAGLGLLGFIARRRKQKKPLN